jgi:hypothetical protein
LIFGCEEPSFENYGFSHIHENYLHENSMNLCISKKLETLANSLTYKRLILPCGELIGVEFNQKD